MALPLAALFLAASCGESSEDDGLSGRWANQSGALTFDDGTFTRRAGRIVQTGSYSVTPAKEGRGRLVVDLDGQKLTCAYTVKGKRLTLAEPCATNFDGGGFNRVE